jgi:hypothetical protein
MAVIVSLDNKKLQRHLKYCPGSDCYICLGEMEENTKQLLEEYAVKELKIDDYDASSSDRFLQSYIDLIGQLGQKHNSIYWWATFTASKNRFASKLATNLSLFCSLIKLINTLKTNSEKDMLVINPPQEICGSIKEYCLANSIGFRLLYNRLYSLFEFTRQIGQQIVNTSFIILNSWHKIYVANRYLKRRLASELQRQNRYYVLRSWFYSSSINENNEYRDSFFGKLPDYLVKKGKNLMVIAGIIGDYKAIVRKIANNNSYLIVPQELFLGYMDPIKAVLDIYGNKIKIRGKIDFNGFDVFSIVKAEMDKEFRSAEILENYIYYYWMRRLLDIVNVDAFTTTCENNPWERMCIMALRQYSPGTRIAGYQHTVVPQASANMFVSKYESGIVPLPDRILTVGEITKRIVEKYGVFEKNRVQESCALRFEYLFNIHPKPRNRSNCILVALEGVFEVYHLVNYVLREIRSHPDYKIRIRTHPALPLSGIIQKLDYNIGSFPHVSVSNVSLERDLDESDMVIYWGSTVSLEALMMGKPIIHFNSGDILSYDPLFECSHLKWVVTRNTNLIEVVDGIYNMDDKEFYLQLKHARKYLDAYFYRITETRLAKFIN